MYDVKVGDTIECYNKKYMLKTMYHLLNMGIDTDFLFEKDGKKGFWLVVVKIESGE